MHEMRKEKKTRMKHTWNNRNTLFESRFGRNHSDPSHWLVSSSLSLRNYDNDDERMLTLAIDKQRLSVLKQLFTNIDKER